MPLRASQSEHRLRQQSVFCQRGAARLGGVEPPARGGDLAGIGGTNAHVVVEEGPPRAPSGASRGWQLLVWSAKTESALNAATGHLRDHLRRRPEENLADMAYTLGVGRRTFPERRALVCKDVDDARLALESGAPDRILTRLKASGSADVVFMFPGSGSQYLNMCREVYDTEPLFRADVDHCADIARPVIGLDIRQVMFSSSTEAKEVEAAERLLGRTTVMFCALMAVEYALARLWMRWGIRPAAMVGHSFGEYAAACIAEVFSIEDAMGIVAIRGRLMRRPRWGSRSPCRLPRRRSKGCSTRS